MGIYTVFHTTVLICLIYILQSVHSNTIVTKAPEIRIHPLEEMAYKKNETAVLSCMANKESKPQYTWKKNGVLLDLTDRGLRLNRAHEDIGDLTILNPSASDNGDYQCFATNSMGTAVTTRSRLKEAVINPFPTVDPINKEPTVGESLTLTCSPPQCYPRDIYWGISKPGYTKLENIPNDARVLLDYEGHLHFANIITEDSYSGNKLVCIVHNEVLGAYVQGNDHKIRPKEKPGGAIYSTPHLMWSSPTRDIAVKGTSKRMKCIFGGFPTPLVTWKRVDSGTSRFISTREGYGTEIEIQNVDNSDEGRYECSATSAGLLTPITHDIRLIVESKPYWTRVPGSKQVDEEANVEFDCQAQGTPQPTVAWMMNGLPLDKVPADPRRRVVGNVVHFSNVTKKDSQVLQCVAENKHGVIMTNVYLTVIAEPPSFSEAPVDSKVVEGKNITLSCHAKGAPMPKIVWYRGIPQKPVFGERYVMHRDGDLEIKDAMLSDTDDYHCQAVNKLGSNRVGAKLLVRRPTVISPLPVSMEANKTNSVTIPCDVSTDAAERVNLKVEWRKNGNSIDYRKDSHMTMNPNNSLTIRNCIVADSAQYTCHADNGLDTADSGPASLVVKDRPASPTNVQIRNCTANVAQLVFTPGSDNNSPVTVFTVYHRINDEGDYIKGPDVDNRNTAEVLVDIRVRPWRNYTFYVTATNTLGTSEYSKKSASTCVTPQMAPVTNPANVCSKLMGTAQLVITWDAVPRDEHFGEGFKYVVSYKLLHSREPAHQIDVTDPEQTDIIIYDRPVFTRYEISVWSANNIGETPPNTRARKIGYSSEGKPLDTPTNFQITPGKFNGTFAEFTWSGVDESPERVRGIFRGYRIKFWKTKDPNNVRVEDIIVNDAKVNYCPSLGDLPSDPLLPPGPARKRSVRSSDVVTGVTGKLWPFSKITAGVSVINTAHDGEISDTVEFETPEGAPEAVKSLFVTEVGSSHITVAWILPEETHGVILSYILEYQVAYPYHGDVHKVLINDSFALTHKILDLNEDTNYGITLSAVTIVGQGQANIIQQRTTLDTVPDQPFIDKVEGGANSAKVSFTPGHDPKKNPGSRFHVEFQNQEPPTDKWNRTTLDPQSPDNWVNITDLPPGVYKFRVVATNGRGGHTKQSISDVVIIRIGGDPETAFGEVQPPRHDAIIHTKTASAGWFVALMCIIVILLIILLIICIIKRSRGDVYPVYEKERILGRDPFAPEDAPFGEYNKGGKPDRSRSQGSLDSDEKPEESDTDSLGEYEDHDASKFNEDGSFIGQYSGKSRPKPDTMNTFV